MTATRWLLAVSIIVAVPAAHAGAQTTSSQIHPSVCADCHYANAAKPNPQHWAEWSRSAHERADVGCDACHGGNPRTTESFLAHQGIVRGVGPDSPVHRSNLPITCGRCHTGPFVQFQKSGHYPLLRNGNRDVPSCSTCHGSASGALLTPKDFERQCNSCHGRGKKFERVDYAGTARRFLQSVSETREMLKQAERAIKRVEDRERRSLLQYSYEQAEVPLTEAVHAAHAFVFVNADERLNVARKRAAALLNALAAERATQ